MAPVAAERGRTARSGGQAISGLPFSLQIGAGSRSLDARPTSGVARAATDIHRTVFAPGRADRPAAGACRGYVGERCGELRSVGGARLPGGATDPMESACLSVLCARG